MVIDVCAAAGGATAAAAAGVGLGAAAHCVLLMQRLLLLAAALSMLACADTLPAADNRRMLIVSTANCKDPSLAEGVLTMLLKWTHLSSCLCS